MMSQTRICKKRRTLGEIAKRVFFACPSSEAETFKEAVRSNLNIVSKSSMKLTSVTPAHKMRRMASFSLSSTIQEIHRILDTRAKLRKNMIPTPNGTGSRACQYGRGLSMSPHFGKK
jgi:hypothetical protein